MTPVWVEGIDRWVAQRIPGCERGFGRCRGLAVVDGRGRLAAGVIFHDWNPERGLIEISCAADTPKWLTRRVMREAFRYAFSVARMVVVRTAESNLPVLHLWRGLGASEYAIADMWADGEACVVFTLTREQWARSKFNTNAETLAGEAQEGGAR